MDSEFLICRRMQQYLAQGLGILLLVVLSAIRSDVLAQIRVKYAVQCPTCRVVLTKVTSLGSAGDREAVGGAFGVERDRRGQFYTIAFDRSQVVIFDSTGRQLRAIGGKGQGPGEFGMRSGVDFIRVGPGDTLHVFHSGSRVEVFAPGGTYVRSVTLPGIVQPYPYVLRDGSYLIGARMSARNTIGLPYHIVTRTGALVRSYGDSTRLVTPQTPAPFPNIIVPSPDEGSFWVMDDTSYTLQERSLDGRPGRRFVVEDSPWYRSQIRVDTTIGRGVPSQYTAVLESLRFAGIDSAGRIWLNGIKRTARAVTADRTFHIEVFDPKSGRIVASQQSTTNPLFMINGSDMAFSARMSSDGMVTFDIWRLTLR